MINPLILNKYNDLYKDFLNPNPNIHSQAILLLKKNFGNKFKDKLLNNLKDEDLLLRRKSILALSEYGEEIFSSIVPLYLNNKNKIVKVSCLKLIIKVIINFNLNELSQEIMVIIEKALKDTSPEITLSVISILRQLGLNGRDILIKTCRDNDLLRAKASVSALLEIRDQVVDDFFHELLHDKSIDPMIKDDILKNKID